MLVRVRPRRELRVEIVGGILGPVAPLIELFDFIVQGTVGRVVGLIDPRLNLGQCHRDQRVVVGGCSLGETSGRTGPLVETPHAVPLPQRVFLAPYSLDPGFE